MRTQSGPGGGAGGSKWTDAEIDALHKAVNKSSELSVSSRSDISSKTGSCKIKWIDDGKRSSSSSSTRCTVSNEEFDLLSLWIIWVENFLILILEGKVQSLCWEITNDICQVSSPEGCKSLLAEYSLKAI